MEHAKFILFLIFVFAGFVHAQSDAKKAAPNNKAAKSSPAYSEVLLRKTERESELEEFLIDYTEDFPKVKELRFELDLIQKEMNKILTVNASEAGKLTLALGKLMVRKAELETDWWNLQRRYNAEHPEVKRAKRKLEVFEKAVKEILQ